MTRVRWTLLASVLIVVALWVFAFRDGLDPLSALAAIVCTAGAALLARDALRGRGTTRA